MMEFLRGLAPRRDGDRSWAMPVVASRFSSARPLGIESPASERVATIVPDVAHAALELESGMQIAALSAADDVADRVLSPVAMPVPTSAPTPVPHVQPIR